MTNAEVRYETKTVTTFRGLEGRSIARWEKEGWDLDTQIPASLMRTTLTFRRPKKQVPKWVWVAAAAAIVIAAIGIGVASTLEKQAESAENVSSPVAAETPTARPAPSVGAGPSANPAASQVTDAEVLGAFQNFFAERTASNVMYAKAITATTFENGVVRVTFNAATAGVDQATFDEFADEFNLPQFVATPIAFSNEIGNRIRPVVDQIETVRTDGSSLGTLDRAGILALNELSE